MNIVLAWFMDEAGNLSDPAVATIILDQTPPSDGVLSAAAGGGYVALNWGGFADGGSGLAPTLPYRLVAGTEGPPAPGCTSGALIYRGSGTSFIHAGLAEGATYHYRLCALDDAGNISEGATVAATVLDVTPPTVRLISPGPETSLAGTVLLVAEAMDALGVAGVRFILDGVPLGAEITAPPYTLAWNTRAVGNGVHVLTAEARDGAGNTATADEVSVTVANAYTLPSGLVAAYAFSEGSGDTTADGSSHGNSGTLVGAAWEPEGRYGGALAFDGESAWVRVAASPTLAPSPAFTMAAWVFPTRTSGLQVAVAHGVPTAAALYACLPDAGNAPAFGVSLDGTQRVVAGGEALPASTWTHVAGTYDGATLRLYVNGVEVASREDSGTLPEDPGPLGLGASAAGAAFFRGRLDDVRLYSRALAQEELQEAMLTPVEQIPPDTVPPTTPSRLTATSFLSSIVLTWGPSADAVGVAGYRIYRDGSQIGTATTAKYTDTGLSPATPYTYTVVAYDFAGNASGASPPASATTLPLDVLPPSVSLTLPEPGATVAGTLAVAATASDDVGVVGVQFLLDGAPLGAEVTTPPYTIAWNTRSVPNGAHTLSARARDAAGNTATAPEVPVTTANTFVFPPGLVAAYAFSEGSGESTADGSGNGNAGTLRGPTWSAGKYGGALAFDGAGDWVTVPHAPALGLTTGVTLAAWVSPTRTTGWQTVVMKEEDALFYLYASTSYGGAPAMGVNIGGYQEVAGQSPLPLNTWTHLAGTYDGTVLRLYINGFEVAHRPLTGRLQTSEEPLRLGGNSIWGEFFQGRLDDVQVYNRALSPAEILEVMTTPVEVTPPDTTPPTVSLAINNGAAATNTVTATLSLSAADAVGLTGYSLATEPTPPSRAAPGWVAVPFATSFSADDVPFTLSSGEGHKTVYAFFKDAAGNVSPAAAATILLDQTPPSDGTLSTAAGSGQVAVSWTGFLRRGQRPHPHTPIPTCGQPRRIARSRVQQRDAALRRRRHQLHPHRLDRGGYVPLPPLRRGCGGQRLRRGDGHGDGSGYHGAHGQSECPRPRVRGGRDHPRQRGGNGCVWGRGRSVLTGRGAPGGGGHHPPFTIEWNTRTVANGPHSLSAQARDGAGNTGRAPAVPITVANVYTLPPGLVAAYPFSEGSGASTADASSRGNAGTLAGATWADGKYGSGLSFDGTSGWVRVAESPTLALSGGLTLAAWVFPTRSNDLQAVLAIDPAAPLALYASVPEARGAPAIEVALDGTPQLLAAPAPLPLETWTHLAGSYDGASLRLYVNGVEVASQEATGALPAAPDPSGSGRAPRERLSSRAGSMMFGSTPGRSLRLNFRRRCSPRRSGSPPTRRRPRLPSRSIAAAQPRTRSRSP